MMCANDWADRCHQAERGALEDQASWEYAQLRTMTEERHPSLITALENVILAAEVSHEELEQLFIERWLAGDELAYQIAPEDQICDALRPHWETERINNRWGDEP